MLVSQRPADVESTVISQCGTWLVLRLTNAVDQQQVSRFLPDGLSGMTKALPNLAQQEAIFVGEGAAMPARVRIRDLTKDQLPKSETAKFAEGWVQERLSKDEIKKGADRMAGHQGELINVKVREVKPIPKPPEDDFPFSFLVCCHGSDFSLDFSLQHFFTERGQSVDSGSNEC